MRTFFTTLCILFFASAPAQTLTTIGGTASSGNSGLVCVNNAVTHPTNITTSSLTDYAQFSLLAGVGCSYYLHATLNGTGAAGTAAGFHVAAANLVNLLSGITLETYLNGQLQESASGADLLSLLSGGEGDIWFQTSKAYDALRIRFTGLVSVAYDIKIYWGFGDNSTVSTLPVIFQYFEAKRYNGQVKLSWMLESVADLKELLVEKSRDGQLFTPIERITKQDSSAHTFEDKETGKAWYRLQAIEKSGKVTWSRTVSIQSGGSPLRSLVVYPNPVAGNQLTVYLAPGISGKLYYSLLNARGTIVQQGTLTHQQVLNVATLPPGVYFLKTSDGAVLPWIKQ